MGLETVSDIASLDEEWPLPGDKGDKGDDHIRNIKKALKFTFPGALGNGFAGQILAKEVELNRLVGVTSPIQTQINTINGNINTINTKLFVAGTRLMFPQASPPSGWTLVTTGDIANRMLRAVTSAGGAIGGVDTPILNNKVPLHNHVATSVVADPGHRHTSYAIIPNANGDPAGGDPDGVGTAYVNTTLSATGVTVTTSIANNAGAQAGNWSPRYLDLIMCSKN